MKHILKISGIILLVILLALGTLLVYLTVTEYRPKAYETAETEMRSENLLTLGHPIRILSWNTGYGGLDESADFFMDGGKMVNPQDKDTVEKNLSAISEFLKNGNYDISLLQEVDRNSDRTGNVDELAFYSEQSKLGYSYAPNYRCSFVPYPLPPIGKVESGIATLSDLSMSGKAARFRLPCPFKWPIRTANLKRCLLINRYSIEGTDKELVTVNLHLEAYDDGEGKKMQTDALIEILQKEYEKGNYVVAGGDFNQTFPESLDIFQSKTRSFGLRAS